MLLWISNMTTASPLYWCYIVALCLSVFLALLMLGYIWRRRSVAGARPLMCVLACIIFWSAGYIIEYAFNSLEVKLFSTNISYIGMVMLPVMLFLFALRFTQHGQWLTARVLALFFIIPAITLILQWTKDYHSLIYYDCHLIEDPPFLLLGKQYGTWFWVAMTYHYSLMISSIFVLVHRLISPPRLFTDQVIYLLIGIFLPLFANISYIFNWLPIPHSDWTPAAFTASCIALTLAITRHGSFEALPVARDSAIELMSEGFLVLDDRERIVDFNQVMQEIIGGSKGIIHGRRLPDHILNKLKQNEDYISAQKSNMEIDLPVGKDTRYYSVHFSPLSDKETLDCGHVLVFYDITERKHAEDLIKQYAYYDQLTGLPNRLLFSDRADQALWRAERYIRKTAVMVIDIDDFKVVNDTYGHSAGDQVLQDISLRLSGAVRRVDTVARLGGDEFLVLLPELTEEDTTGRIARRIIQSLSFPFSVSGKGVSLSASIGIAVFPDDASSVDQLVKYADLAMYSIKQAGRNGYRRYSTDLNNQHSDSTSG